MTSTLSTPTPLTTPAAKPRFWATRRLLIVLGVVSVVLTAGFGAYVGAMAAGVRSGLNVIGQQAAPQVKASSDLYFALSSMDAQAANVLLVGTDPTLSDSRTYAVNAYEESRIAADNVLRQIAVDAAADANIEGIITSAADRLGRYEAAVTQAFLLNVQGNDPAGSPSASVLALYQQATDAMRLILAEVQTVTNLSQDLLNSTYASESGSVYGAEALLVLFGVLLIVCLIATQVMLVRRVRRRLNPALVLATVASLVITMLGAGMLGNENYQLYVAKSQAFDSIVALSQARSVSNDANADESRFLIDPQRGNQYLNSFQSKSQSLLTLPNVDITPYDAALASALQAYHANNSDVRFTGFFGTEMRNITFSGERAAAEATLAAYQLWQTDDRHMRSLAASGDLAGATKFEINNTPGNAFYDFNQYDIALFDLIQINQVAFDSAVSNAGSSVSGWTAAIPTIAGLLIIGLIGLGLWPRISEYR